MTRSTGSGLTSMLLEPELLDSVQPDVHLAATLVSLNRVMPETAKRTARLVVGKVVAEIERRIANSTRAAVRGAVSRSSRTRRPRLRDVDWNATIRRNLDRYIPERRTVVPERLVGYGHRAPAMSRDVIVAVDQSGSMAESVVYAAVFGATLASISSVRTSLVAFDVDVVDLTDRLADPVEVLFGCQLGGGTDINRALAYCQGLVSRPAETILVLISDLFEGGIEGQLVRRVAELVRDGVTVVALLALADSGRTLVRPRARRRAGRSRRTRLRLYAGPVPRPAVGGDQRRRHRSLGGPDRSGGAGGGAADDDLITGRGP